MPPERLTLSAPEEAKVAYVVKVTENEIVILDRITRDLERFPERRLESRQICGEDLNWIPYNSPSVAKLVFAIGPSGLNRYPPCSGE